MKAPKYARAFQVSPALPESLAPLRELASNFRWTWQHPVRDLFREIDRELWDEANHNPLELLARVDPARLERLAADPAFLGRLTACHRDLCEYLGSASWYATEQPDAADAGPVAYFCAEFGVSESLPIYSGGLGVLAGDHLKAASDLGLPLVGVGLLYSRGYFRQALGPEGWQQERYPDYDFYGMALELQRDESQRPIRVTIEFPDGPVVCQVWRAMIGRVPLYLLDSNVLENRQSDQAITDTLYGGDSDMRLRQEMILGIGGLRALAAVGIQPAVCHMNEGHAAFLALERIRSWMASSGGDFATARRALFGSNVFTTHTPVPAGFDVFPPDMLRRYLGAFINDLGITFDQFLALGRVDAQNDGEPFNMAIFAMSMSEHVNGVSKLHAQVSRRMFQNKWPQILEQEVPIRAITNGVHTETWMSRRVHDLITTVAPSDWPNHLCDPAYWNCLDELSDSDLWEVRESLRTDFVRNIRKRLRSSATRQGAGGGDLSAIHQVLDPRVLTIGFARRFATYKRATLILHDRERLKRLLFHSERPIQFVFAGKSHPRDDGGKQLIQEIVRFIEENQAAHRMVFLEDYDMGIARAMVQGVDVWLNNPRRPMEASGTSGMKAALNGSLNCSILDGWWDEGYREGAGWAIGDREPTGDDSRQDWLESRALYDLIEYEIAPKFYARGEDGIPHEWVHMVRKSIATLMPEFSSRRMVRDYALDCYAPAALAYRDFVTPGPAPAKEILAWSERIAKSWGSVRILSVSDDAGVSVRRGQRIRVEVKVDLGSLSPSDVRVQAVAGRVAGNRELVNTTVVDLHPENDVFVGDVDCVTAGHMGYTVRVVPDHPRMDAYTELGLATWENGRI